MGRVFCVGCSAHMQRLGARASALRRHNPAAPGSARRECPAWRPAPAAARRVRQTARHPAGAPTSQPVTNARPWRLWQRAPQAHFAAQPGAQAAQGFRPLLRHPVQAGVVQRQAVGAQRRRLAQGGSQSAGHWRAPAGAKAARAGPVRPAGAGSGAVRRRRRVGVQTQAHAARCRPANACAASHTAISCAGLPAGRVWQCQQGAARPAHRPDTPRPGPTHPAPPAKTRARRLALIQLTSSTRKAVTGVGWRPGRVGSRSAQTPAPGAAPARAGARPALAVGCRARAICKSPRATPAQPENVRPAGCQGHAAKVGDQLFDGKRHEGWLFYSKCLILRE